MAKGTRQKLSCQSVRKLSGGHGMKGGASGHGSVAIVAY